MNSFIRWMHSSLCTTSTVTPAAKELFFSHKCRILTDDDAWDPIQQNCARAHGTRRERGIQNAFAIKGCRLAAGVFQRVHFSVQNTAAFLHATVVPTPNDSIVVHNHRADGDATF